MGGRKRLRCAIVGEVSTKSFDELSVESINENLTDAYWEWVLVNEGTGST